jgi:transposase
LRADVSLAAVAKANGVNISQLSYWRQLYHQDQPRAAPAPEARANRARKPLPEHLPRDTVVHVPSADACPECGGTLKEIGADVAEQIEYVPQSWRVIRHVRPKFSCACCQTLVQASAPSRPIARGLAGPSLLAHVIVSKYCDHSPLYRQARIYARDGLELERSTLSEWVGGVSRLLRPLVDALRRCVMAGPTLHADDTPVPMLASGKGKTAKARLWAYVRGERSAGSTQPAAVWMAFTPDREGEHPQRHLEHFAASSTPTGSPDTTKCLTKPGPMQRAGHTHDASSMS